MRLLLDDLELMVVCFLFSSFHLKENLFFSLFNQGKERMERKIKI